MPHARSAINPWNPPAITLQAPFGVALPSTGGPKQRREGVSTVLPGPIRQPGQSQLRRQHSDLKLSRQAYQYTSERHNNTTFFTVACEDRDKSWITQKSGSGPNSLCPRGTLGAKFHGRPVYDPGGSTPCQAAILVSLARRSSRRSRTFGDVSRIFTHQSRETAGLPLKAMLRQLPPLIRSGEAVIHSFA